MRVLNVFLGLFSLILIARSAFGCLFVFLMGRVSSYFAAVLRCILILYVYLFWIYELKEIEMSVDSVYEAEALTSRMEATTTKNQRQ